MDDQTTREIEAEAGKATDSQKHLSREQTLYSSRRTVTHTPIHYQS